MSSDPSNLSSLARSKLHSSVGGKDKSSLHRWVLLKNSIIASLPVTPSPTSTTTPTTPTQSVEEPEDTEDDEVDSFLFPDVGKLVQVPIVETNDPEAQWLDSLLESLGDDEDYDETDAQEDDDDQLLSPFPSPMSSSDDLPNFYPPPLYPPLSVPYSVSFHQPCYTYNSPCLSVSPSYDNPLPYRDQDDLEELSVPDAIEDTSDDDSEALETPSLGRSRSSISLVDPASIPLPVERARNTHPHIYIDSDDSYFYPFDPLPFPHNRLNRYDTLQEC